MLFEKSSQKSIVPVIVFFIMSVVFPFVPLKAQIAEGTVWDENGDPMPFVTVSLRTLPDSVIVNGGITDMDGKFMIESDGKWQIAQVSMMGYVTETLKLQDFASGGADVHMRPDTKVLDEVVITGILPKTEIKGNAVVTSVAGSVLEHYGNAQNVLDKVPGMITIGDKLEVLGRGEPVIYINGRKMTDDSELRNLMAADIKSIEVISNPGAMYGGDVNSVVIIRTVKRQGDGFSYALTSQARQHIYDNHDFDPSWTVLDLNYRNGGWDWFGKIVYWNQRGYQNSGIEGGSIVSAENGILTNTQVGTLNYVGHNGGFQYIAGANWQISDNHSVGMKVGLDRNTIGNSNMVMENDIFRNGQLIDHLIAVNDSHNNDNDQLSGNLYYDGKIDKLGINFNADFMRGGYTTVTDVTETGWTGPATMESESGGDFVMGAGKLILSYPVWKGSLQTGVEETYFTAGQNYRISGVDIPQTDALIMENTIAGFAEYALGLPFGQLSAGMRYEHVNFDYTDRIVEENSMTRRQDNWFPSFSFSTKAGPVSMNLSYTYKTIRPRFDQMTTEVTYDNRFTYQSGDPTMKNEIHRTLALNAGWQWVNLSASYENIENSFFQWASPYSNDGVVMIRYANSQNPLDKIGAYLNAAPVVGVWNPRVTIGLEKQFYSLTVNDPRADGGQRTEKYTHPMFLFQAANAFNFKHNWALDADYQYISPCNDLLMYIEKPIQRFDLGLSKSFFRNEALTARIAWNDIFNSSVPYFRSDYGYVYNNQNNDGYAPSVELRLSYRFNSAGSKYKGTGAGQSVKDRM